MKHHYVFRKPGHRLDGVCSRSFRRIRQRYALYMGIDRTYLSPPRVWAFLNNTTSAWCIYSNAHERDNDDTGADALWIVRIPGSP